MTARNLPIALLVIVTASLLGGEILAEERDCEGLLSEARTGLETATDAFNRLGDEGSDSHETRLEAEVACETAMGNCDIALEYHEDECGVEAEDIMTKATSLYFWVHRTAPLSFFDWKAERTGKKDEDGYSADLYEEITRRNREEGTPDEGQPGETPPLEPGDDELSGDGEQPPELDQPKAPTLAELACEKLEAARAIEKKDSFEAVMAYSELASMYPEQDCGKQAMTRVAEIMRPDSSVEQPSLNAMVSFLKKNLSSKEPRDRIRAAREAKGLKASMVVRPLVDALRKEDKDSPVTQHLLNTLRTTHRRATCRELGDLKRFKDKNQDRQIAVIDCLNDVGGPLGAEAIGQFLGSKNQKVIDRCFERLEAIGIDGGMGLASGFGGLLKNRTPKNVNKCLSLMGKLKHPVCASMIVARGKGLLSDRKGMFFDKAKEALIAIGWNASWVLIEEGMGCGNNRTRVWSQYCVKQITGWVLGMSNVEWKQRWRTEVSSGARPLPYGYKRIP